MQMPQNQGCPPPLNPTHTSTPKANGGNNVSSLAKGFITPDIFSTATAIIVSWIGLSLINMMDVEVYDALIFAAKIDMFVISRTPPKNITGVI